MLDLNNLPAVTQLGNIVFDPSNLPAGTYSFEYTVRDSGGRSVRQTVTITLTNANPVLAADAIAATEDGGAIAGNVLANDADPEGRALTVTRLAHGADSQAVAAGAATVIAGTYGALSLNADGSYSFALDNTLGTVQALRAGQTATDSFTYTVIDPNGGTATAQIAVTVTGVNDAPRFTGNQAFNIREGRFDVAQIAASDIDGDTLTYSIAGGPDADRFFLDDLTGQLSFRTVTSVANPGDADGDNVYEIIVSITDGTVTVTRPLTITVSLNGAPEPPIATDATASITEDAAQATVSGLLAASDPNNDPLTFSQPGGNTVTGVFGQLTVAANGTFTYTLNNADADTNGLGAGQTATDVFTYQVDDGTGQPPATAQVRITVTGANDAPTIAATRAVTVNAGTTAVTSAGDGADPDSNSTLRYTIAGTDAALFAVNAQTGALAFATPPSFSNPQDQGGDNVYDLTLTVSDGSLTASQAVAVTVLEGNRAPVANPDPATGELLVTEDDAANTVTGNILANDSDLEDDAAQVPLRVATVNGEALTDGSVTIAGTYGSVQIFDSGAFVYTLDNSNPATNALSTGDRVTETFSYTAEDSNGAQSTPATLTITVDGNSDFVNTPPVAVNDTNTITEAPSGRTNVTGNVLANDTDIDTGQTLVVANPGTYTGTYGVLTLNANGTYTYEIDNDSAIINDLNDADRPTDEFSYTISDDFVGGTATASLTVAVQGFTDPPPTSVTARTDSVVLTFGGTDSQTLNILDNDSPATPGLNLEVVLVNNAGVETSGSFQGADPTTYNVLVTGNGTFEINPSDFNLAPNEVSTATLSYRVAETAAAPDGDADPGAQFADGTITITVRGSPTFNIPSVVANSSFTAATGATGGPVILDNPNDALRGGEVVDDDRPLSELTIRIEQRPVGTLSIGQGGAALAVGSTLAAADLRNLYWQAPDSAGPQGQLVYSVTDADGNRADADLVTAGQQDPTVTFRSVSATVDLNTLTGSNGYTYTVNANSNGTETTNAQFGFSLATAVDTTNGNIVGGGATTNRDLVIGAPNSQSGAGAVFVVELSNATNAATVASGNRDFTGTPGERLGYSVAVGEVIDDSATGNRADLILGAPGADSNAGRVYIIAGVSSGSLAGAGTSTNLGTLPGATNGVGNGYRINGTSAGAAYDSNFDRIEAANAGSDLGSNLGAAVGYLFNGTGPNLNYFAAAPGDDSYFSYRDNAGPGSEDSDSPPLPVTGVSDVGNVYIPVRRIDTQTFTSGSGTAIGSVETVVEPGTFDTGTGYGYTAGYAGGQGSTRAAFGIIDGNAEASNAPGLTLVLGNAEGRLSAGAPVTGTVTFVLGAGTVITTAETGIGGELDIDFFATGPFVLGTGGVDDRFGASVAMVNLARYITGGDPTNGSRPDNTVGRDVLIGSPGRDSSPNGTDNVGSVVLLFGNSLFFQNGDVDPDGAGPQAPVSAGIGTVGGYVESLDAPSALLAARPDALRYVEIRGVQANSGFGAVVANIGDFNGDNVEDFAVGAPDYDGPNGVDSGAVFVFFGKFDQQSWLQGQDHRTINLNNLALGVDYIRIDGKAGSHAGAAIVGVGNVNGDTATAPDGTEFTGFNDIAIGAPTAGGNGEVHIVYGYAIGQIDPPLPSIDAAAPAPQFSASVSIIDADGGVDAVLAAAVGPADAPAALDPGAFGDSFDKALPLTTFHNDGMVLHIA
ncbi:MAG: tandem-95 repeat protein [Sphingomonadales bacterium]|nr:MAG: tandem-95 repeat protein [Sphingomonadales bacterium]